MQLRFAPARHKKRASRLESQQIQQLLVALSRLALCHGAPFVLARDLVDNLDEDRSPPWGALSGGAARTAPKPTRHHLRISDSVELAISGRRATLCLGPHRATEGRLQKLNLPVQQLCAPAARLFCPLRSLDGNPGSWEDVLFPLGRAWV